MKTKNKFLLTMGIGAALGTCSTQAQTPFVGGSFSGSIAALSSFGNNGWLAPNGTAGSTFPYLTTGSAQRGLAYGDGDLFLVQAGATPSVDILSPSTGAFLGTLNTTGVSGGTFGGDMITVGADGTVFLGNLTTSATSPFNVYAYTPASIISSSAPVLVYSGNPLGGGTRLGDSLAATGRGSATTLVAGFGGGSSGYETINIPSITANSGVATAVAFTGNPPATSDFKLGIAFTDASHVIGTQSSSPTAGNARFTSFSGGTGTLVSSPVLSGAKDTVLGYLTLGGDNILISASTGDNHVSVYDMSNPLAVVDVASINNTTGTLTANGNETGAFALGPVTADPDGTSTAEIFTLSSGDGIQAFTITISVPEPSSLALAGVGVVSGLLWRRRRAVAK